MPENIRSEFKRVYTPDEFAVDKPVKNWKMETGKDAKGNTVYKHDLLVKSKGQTGGSIHTQEQHLVFQGNVDLQTQVLALKCWRNINKSLHMEESQLAHMRMKKGQTASVIEFRDKDKNLLGNALLFPPNKDSHDCPYTYTRDGKKLLLTNFWGNALTDQKDMHATLLRHFERGDIGYDVKEIHKRKEKEAAGVSANYGDTRYARAEDIANQLKLQDKKTIEATKVPAAQVPPPSEDVDSDEEEEKMTGEIRQGGQLHVENNDSDLGELRVKPVSKNKERELERRAQNDADASYIANRQFGNN